MPEIEAAMRGYYTDRLTKKYEHSRTLSEIIDLLEKNDIPMWEEFAYYEEYPELNGRDHNEIMEIFMLANMAFLQVFAGFTNYYFDETKANKEELADYLANIVIKDRDFDYYEDEIAYKYKCMIEAILEQYRIDTYDSDKLGLWNYEDKIIDELYISNGTLLEEYCDGDLSKLGEIYFEENPRIIYEGTLEELSEEVQLYLKLR